MKIVELLNNLQVPLNNEEWEILSKFNESDEVKKSDLEPREQLLANQLVTKDVLMRKRTDDGKLAYRKKIR